MEQEPESRIKSWFNEQRLERFAASFEQTPGLWHASHADCDGQSSKAVAYMHLLDSLGESTDGDAHARLSCAVALCRVFCRLLREKLRWAVGESLAGGTNQEVALALCPNWARRAERYLRYLPLMFHQAEELKTKTTATDPLRRSDKNKPAKRPRPVPGLVPLPTLASIAPSSNVGKGILRRVVCGMRRAAVEHGLTRQAAGVVAQEIGNVEERVYALWCALRQLVEVKFSALLARGDAPAQSGAGQLTCLDWAVADLLMLHVQESSPVDESSYQQYKQQLALLGTFHLVQRFGLEGPEREPPPQRWHEAASWYSNTGVKMSPVGLQRRWHEMKKLTRRRMRALLGAGAGDARAPAQPLLRAIASRYPHVVTGPLRAWHALVAAGLAAKPTNERGTKSRDKPPDEGDELESSGGRTSAASVSPGLSKRTKAYDNAVAKPSGKKVSSECNVERKSNNVHDKEGLNRNNENTEGLKKTIDVNKEIIDVDAPSSESDEIEKNQKIDDRNTCNKSRQNGGKTVSKANVPNSGDFATQMCQQIEKKKKSDRDIIEEIEKELFSNHVISRSRKNRSTATQNGTNLSNSEVQSKTNKSNGGDVVAKDTISSGNMNTIESNSNIANDPNKHPLLTQMLQTVCIYDDDDRFTTYLEKNKQISKSIPGLCKSTNFHEIENKSLVSVGSKNKHRKRASEEPSNDWTKQIVKAVKKQRLEIEAFANSQICKLFNGELSGDNVNKGNKIVQTDSDDSDSVIDLDSDDGSIDNQGDAGNVEGTERGFDPKLLMYPIVLMTRMENDPSLRILPAPSTSFARSPLSHSQSPSPSPSSEPLISFNATTPSPKYLFHENTRALLKLCKPCVVLLDPWELEGVGRGGGRLMKRVELQDIEEVRRNNRSMLTAQVAPLANREGSDLSSETDSCDSEWTPEEDNMPHPAEKPAWMKDQKNTDDNLRRLLNDFVGEADAACCEHSKRIKMRGELAVTASLAVERGCVRCMWRLLSSPPTSAAEAQLQRRLLRHAVPQPDTATAAPKIAEVPKKAPKRQRSKKRVLPNSATEIDNNAAPEKQSIPPATAPHPATAQPDAPRTYAGLKVRRPPTEPARRSAALAEEHLVRRVNGPIFRPEAVADINRRLGMLVEDSPPVPGVFDPVITSVLSLAPKTDQQKKTPTELTKKLLSKPARATPDLTERPPVSVTERQSEPASSYDPRSLPNYVVPTSQSGSQPRLYLQPHSPHDPQRVNMPNALQPQIHNMTHSTGDTRLPSIQTVDGQIGSQYFAHQEICLGNILVHPNTLSENVIQTQCFQNATCADQGNCVYNQQTSAFQPILHINANQANQYLNPTMSHPNPFAMAPGFSPNVALLENSMVATEQQNTFGLINAGSSQTFFNSMRASESQYRRSPPPYDAAVSFLAASRQKSMPLDYTQAGSWQVNPSRASASAVEVVLDGEATPQAEQYDLFANDNISEASENNSFARLEQYLPPVPSHEWVVGRDPSTLSVLCTDAYRQPWTLLGRFLVLSELELPPPSAEVWALSPRVRLRLPPEGNNPSQPFKPKPEPDDPTADPDTKPTRIKVKSFARMVSDSPDQDDSQDWRSGLAPPRLYQDDNVYQKLSDDPLIYAKLLVAVGAPAGGRALLSRGAPLQLYCLHTCRLYPLHAQPVAPGGARCSLSGDRAVSPALHALARQLSGGDGGGGGGGND